MPDVKQTMKALPVVLIISLMLSTNIVAIAISYQHQPVEIIELNYHFSDIQFIQKNQQTTLSFNEPTNQYIKKNHYIIPTYTETVTFPFGTTISDIRYTIDEPYKQTLSEKIQSAPHILQSTINSQSNQHQSEKIETISSWCKIDQGVGLIKQNQRGLIVKVQLFPIQYQPEINQITGTNSISVDIEYQLPSDKTVSTIDQYSLVIITSQEYETPLEPLVTHKNDRGVSTKLVSLDDIQNSVYFPVQGRDEPENIKYFLLQAIENWQTTHALFIGNQNTMPVRYTHVLVDYQDGDDEVFACDLYYADIYDTSYEFSNWDTNENDIFGEYNWGEESISDDVDLYPDLYIGRLPCINEQQVQTIVEKIITYENQQAFTKEWFTNLVVIGGDSSPGDLIDEGEYVNQYIIDVMDGFVPDRIWDSNNRLSGITPTGVNAINTAINQGCGWVDFSGHGAPWVWTTYPHNGSRQTLPSPTGRYTNTIASNLNNQDKLPILITDACSVFQFNTEENCFGWSFVANPTGGAIGSFGSSALSYFYGEDYVTEALVPRLSLNMFEAYKNGATTFGELWVDGIRAYLSPSMEDYDIKTVEEWLAFGDPSLQIKAQSLPPQKPSAPSGPEEGRIGETYIFSASTSDPEEENLFYLFDWGNEENSGWIGPFSSGELCEVEYSWTTQGSFSVRVKAKDIHGVQSEWSDSSIVSMPRNRFDFLLSQFRIHLPPIFYDFLSVFS